jgi:mono/diheme cytochrome c family protein
MIRAFVLLAVVLGATPVMAADVAQGRRVAEARCVPCHALAQPQPRQISEAPPFEVIARKYAVSPESLAFAVLDPHPRMNMTISRREAEDIAAYINSLAR